MSNQKQILSKKAMLKAFSDAGNIKGLSERLGYSYSRVRSWSARGYVPANECPAVAEALGHSVSVLALMGCEPVDEPDEPRGCVSSASINVSSI